MSISINSHEGGPIEGHFGSQLEQRVGHRDIDHENELGPLRRISEGSRLSSDSRQFGQHPHMPSPRPTADSWLRLPWNLWGGRSGTNTPTLRPQLHINSPAWWNPRRYQRLSVGSVPAISTAKAARIPFFSGAVRKIQVFIAALAATAANNNRRRGWFLSLVLVSLVLTVFMGGYLLSQLHYQRELGPLAGSLSGDDDDKIILDPGSGPRRDRSRGKKNRGPSTAPTKQVTPSKDTGVDHTKGGVDGSIDSKQDIDVEHKDGNTGHDDEVSSPEIPPRRICNLEDVARGQWTRTSSERKTSAWQVGQDLSWTGYGHNGCRSNIWNERYLLTPSILDTKNSTYNKDLLQKDQEYAWHLKGFYWRLDQRQRRKQQQQQEPCLQPEMDTEDFVEVLKRAPLVMIGDKFLEQEYLAMECMIMGMQDQLWIDYQSEHDDEVLSKDDVLNALDYRIESETPPIVELKVAPSSLKRPPSSPSTTGAGGDQSALYRKAKPGQMRLVDRLSNLTLITFIRSDVLWDSDMLTGQVAKHALKSVAELSNLDAGGLHPDCKLVGAVLLCEPAYINIGTGASPSNPQAGGKSSSSAARWWQWWIESQDDSDNNVVETKNGDGEMSFGSDFDRDMINLEWVRQLEEIVQDAAIHRENASKQRYGAEGDKERKPVVVISSGHFWEYDPQDALDPTQQGIDQNKMSKAELKLIIHIQEKRRKLLRQRYTMVLTNTLDYIKATYPDLRVVVQTSVKRGACKSGAVGAAEKELREAKDQEAALLNALTKTVVARMQDPLYAFLDTTLLRVFKDDLNKRHCSNFMMPGPLDAIIHHLYGELYRLDL